MTLPQNLDPEAWGLGLTRRGELEIGGCSALELARVYGTPLHVVDAAQLEQNARRFQQAFAATYPGRVSAHFAFKCNNVPGIAQLLRALGMKAEVMSEFELELALRLGHPGSAVIVNGPFKPESLLRACIAARVRFIVVDSFTELGALERLGGELGKPVDVLLRINPDFVPRGMNRGSATASRRGAAFGLDLAGGEVDRAFDWLARSRWLCCHGLHLHIGTGIDHPDDYRRALLRLAPVVERARRQGPALSVLDAGGGFAARTSREMTELEMLVYQTTGRLPTPKDPDRQPTFGAFAEAITEGASSIFGRDLPELLLEPGRSITSSSQLLLLTVHGIKQRSRGPSWVITDGGLGTVTLPTFYEVHEVLVANDPYRARTQYVTITGPVCFSGDIVYRNKKMPPLEPGEVLAVMDSGAYFTALESSFGFPRPAIVLVRDGRHRLLRRREIFTDMILRDEFGDETREDTTQ